MRHSGQITELLQERYIVKREQNGVCFDVTLSCGHSVTFVVEPPCFAYCSQCLLIALAAVKALRAEVSENERD